MARSSVGLVLRPHAVEVVEARQGFRSVTVTNHARVPLSDTDDSTVVSAIHTALQMAHIKTTPLAVTVPAQEVLLRSFRLPLIPKTEWNTAIQFEARKYIPFKTEELAWGFHAIEERNIKQLMVVFVGIRTESFVRIQRVLKAAGLQATCLEAPWASLARLAAYRQGVPDDQFLGIVEIEPHTAHIVIVKDQVPYLARDVNLTTSPEPGADQPRPNLQGRDEATKTDTAIEQAVDSKRSDTANVGRGQSPVEPGGVEKLLSEIRLSFDFFTREHPSTSINQLLLFGDLATAAPWASWLAQQLHCAVTLGTLPLERTSNEPVDLGCGLAVGLALRELRPSSIKLDFVERAAAQTAPTPTFIDKFVESLPLKIDPVLVRSLVMPTVISAGVAGAAVAALAVLGNQQVMIARQQLERMTRSFSDVGYGLAEKGEDELQALKQRADGQAAFLRKTIEQRVSVTEKLDALAKALPEGMWLEGVAYEDRLNGISPTASSLVLRGACFLPNSNNNEVGVISDFVQRIKEDKGFFKGFTTSQLGGIAKAQAPNKYSYRTFELNCQSERRTF